MDFFSFSALPIKKGLHYFFLYNNLYFKVLSVFLVKATVFVMSILTKVYPNCLLIRHFLSTIIKTLCENNEFLSKLNYGNFIDSFL